MIVWAHIWESYRGQIKVATDEQRGKLEKEILALKEWGERRVAGVNDVPFSEVEKCFVYKYDGKPVEITEVKTSWDLERGNIELLKDVDARIAESYRAMKKAGFERPSTLLFCRMFEYLHSAELGPYYEGKPKLFASVALVMKRLESTCRIALRYSCSDKFGPVKVIDSEGLVEYQYKSKALEKELVLRGVVKSK